MMVLSRATRWLVKATDSPRPNTQADLRKFLWQSFTEPLLSQPCVQPG